jgi:hypothetical protein
MAVSFIGGRNWSTRRKPLTCCKPLTINVLGFFHLFIIYYFSFHSCLQFSRGVLDTNLCNKVCQWLAAGQWFSPGTPVSSTNKTDRHDITDILLKVVLNTINHASFH